MKKILLILLTLTLSFNIIANDKTGEKPLTTPNEKKIYFHLHQSTFWMNAHFLKKSVHAQYEMGVHLGTIKFSETRLVDSVFYEDFKFLYNLIRDLDSSSLKNIEELRLKMSLKAKALNIQLPNNWKNEFHFLN